MPEYKPWLGISIWIFGSALAVLLAIQGIITRNEASLLVWVFFAIPIVWSCNDGANNE